MTTKQRRQYHRFDPEHPLLTASRPNPFGWVLLLGGAVMAVLLTFFRSHFGDLEWWQWALIGAYTILLLAVGVKLLRQPGRPSRDHDDRAA